MAYTDRAFRALAQERPDLVLALLRAAGVEIAQRADVDVVPEEVDDSQLVRPATPATDLVARLGADALLHVECQGYRDPDFADRVLRYHLTFVLRYPARRVHTVALWVIRPQARQRAGEIERHGVRLQVTSLVLREIPAELLLSDARTVCFAAGADAGGRSDDQLCDAIVQRLQAAGAGQREFDIAAVLAATMGRYGAMVSAMQRAKVETVILEDLVHFGEDRGFERGVQEGREQGREQGEQQARSLLLATLLDILGARALQPTPAQRERIDQERSVEVMRRWCQRACMASSVEEMLSG